MITREYEAIYLNHRMVWKETSQDDIIEKIIRPLRKELIYIYLKSNGVRCLNLKK
jgi:hypothetical protein